MTQENLSHAMLTVDADAYTKEVDRLLQIRSLTESAALLQNFKDQYPNLVGGLQAIDTYAELRGMNAPTHSALLAGFLIGLASLPEAAATDDPNAGITSQVMHNPLFLEASPPASR